MMKKESQPLTPRSDPSIPNPEKVKVALRIRPALHSEDPEQFITLVEDNVISINKTGIPSLMRFNTVQIQSQEAEDQASTRNQERMYSFVADSVKTVFEGVQAIIFAYGQTGAGKTYTIVGDCPESGVNTDFRPFLVRNSKGIMVRAMENILTESRKKRDSRITISFFEVYNEKIYDLLTNSPKPLELRQGRNGQISIPGLIFVEVTDIKESINYIAEGLKNRVTCSTSGNIKSSRSHSIFHVKIQKLLVNKQTGQHDIIVSNLKIVDLAGSEKFNIPHDVSQSEREIRLAELKSINGSLSKLGHCISALTSHSRSHIPFRDSKLTRILSESLLGSSKIRLIVCVSPSVSAMNETASTLQFADRVKKAIFERPVSPFSEKKRMIEYSEYQAVVEELEKQRNARQELQRILKSSKHVGGDLELMRENDRLRQEVTLLKQQLKVFKNRVKVGTHTLNISRSKSKSTNRIETHNNHSPLLRKPTKVLASNTLVKNTPPKTTSSKSVIEYESRSKNSIDLNMNGKNNRKDGSVVGHKKQPSDLERPERNEKSTFQNRVKKFMEKSDIDRELEEKVKQRLKQIRKEIVNHREWVEKSDEEDLWRKQ